MHGHDALMHGQKLGAHQPSYRRGRPGGLPDLGARSTGPPHTASAGHSVVRSERRASILGTGPYLQPVENIVIRRKIC